MFLNADDVADILKLIDGAPIDELQLQTDRFNLLLRRNKDGDWTQQKQELLKPNLKEQSGSKVEDKIAASKKEGAEDRVAEHLVPIPTPMPGTFYRAPKPGAAAFVEIGDKVKKDTVVAIIETMKLMNSIMANTEGTVVEICVENAEFADQDTVLIRIDPEK
jgi:acetyl-CoA carboxylase biotin carboxyl carrier protein